MGLTSGRGGRGGARGSGRDGYAGRENGGQRGRTSLVSRDGYGQQGDNRLRGEYATRYANGQHDYYASYASPGQGDGHPRPGGYPGGRGRGRRTRYRRRAGYGRRRGISVPVIAVVAMVASVAVVAAAAGVNRMLTARPAAADAPAVNVNCTLIVPADPLTAGGLAAPYQLTATDPASGPCNEANTSQTAFVQGAVLDPATGKISVYNPLVIDAGTQPAVAPVVPVLPAGAVVAVWFGFNGNTLTLAGADQAPALAAQGSATAGSSAPAQGTPSSTAASGDATATDTAAPTASPAASGTDPSAGPAAATQPSQPTAPASAPATATVPATPATPTAAAAAVNSASSTDAPKAVAEAEGAAPLSPANAGSAAGYDATLTRVAGSGSSTTSGRSSNSASSSAVAQSGQASQSAGSPAASVSPSVAGPAAGSAGASGASGASGAPASPAPAGTAPASGSASASATASAGAGAIPTAAAGDGPAASGIPDAILQQANCVAGQNVGGQFSSFTQMGACNAAAFFSAANAAIRAGKLTVPPPGTASDGRPCLTTRSFALIDQDQSDNVTTQYLAEGNGQTAQDTAANRQAMTGAAGLFNGSDNGLLDFFVDPALGCTPWQVPDLADGGAPATALPLDELQAARYSGGRGNPAALVPLNDPMTLDNNGQFSRAKTNTYRSLVDMRPLPAGESPAAYCLDMERIQGQRLQQDVNLLIGRAGPAPDAANSLFTFLAMRLQQSFANLSCGSFGIRNVVSTTADASGVVVAACFLNHVAPLTPGSGNPMGATATCPATTVGASPSGPAGQPGAGSGSPGPGSSASPSAPAASPTPSGSARQRHYRRHHWWW